STPSSRANLRTDGLAYARANPASSTGGRLPGCFAADGAEAGASVFFAGEGAVAAFAGSARSALAFFSGSALAVDGFGAGASAAPPSSCAIKLPLETRSPFFTAMD